MLNQWDNVTLSDLGRWFRHLEATGRPGGEFSSILECMLNRSSYEDYVADTHSQGSNKLNDVVKLAGSTLRPNERG